MALRAPFGLALCGSDKADCGYVNFQVSNDASMKDAITWVGASLSCPPFCPGALSNGTVPIPSGQGFVLGYQPSLATLPTLLQSTSAVSSEGFYFAAACSQTGLFPDPVTTDCGNASDPLSYQCAHGSGDACSVCNIHAVCPGGFRK